MNIFRKLRIFKNTAVTAHGKIDQNFWRNTFQDIEKRVAKNDDQEKIKSDRDFLKKHWREIHDSGIDLERILKIMDPLEILYQFKELQAAGMQLDINQIVYSIHEWPNNKVDLHYLHSLDADMDQIAYRGNLEPNSLDEINNLIINGVSVQTTFELSEDYILGNADYPDNLFKILSFFYTLSITSEQIRSIISRIIPTIFVDEVKLFPIKSIIDDIVNSSPDKWPSIGIKPSEYAKPWICLNYYRYLGVDSGKTLSDLPSVDYGKTLADLPEAVSVHDFIYHVSLGEVEREISYQGYTFDQFIRRSFLPAGGDIEQLAQKSFSENIDYEDPVGWLILAAIYVNGGKLINRYKLSKYANPTNYFSVDLKFITEYFPKILTDREEDPT